LFSLVATLLLPVGAASITGADLDKTTVDGLVARLAPDHPRLGFRPRREHHARTFDGVRRTYKKSALFRRLYQRALERRDERCDAVMLASKWIVTGQDRYARQAIKRLVEARIEPTAEAGYYSPVWRWALAYDWLTTHPAMTDAVRRHIEDEIVRVLRSELEDLDGGGPSMWHGRNQYANNALVAALSLSHHPQRSVLLRRVLAHYLDAVRALRLVESWPEGPPYWIYNRAIQYALAADCVRTAFGVTTVGEVDLVETLRATGYWQLHSLMPNFVFTPYGDGSGGRLGASQPWMESADYFARYTRDPGLIAAADWMRPRALRDTYRPGRFGWGLVLSYDPDLPMPADYDPTKPAEFFDRHVPTARLFGRTSTGMAFFRSSWSDRAATHVSFKAGDLFAHHGHYDQGTFTIFKRTALAPHAGGYRGYTSEHRVGFYIQTVGANSLLILAPGEFSNFLRERKHHDALSGGQRVVMATGSSVPSVADWHANRNAGQHFEAGGIIAYQSVPKDYDYIAADITAAYNSIRYTEPGNRPKVSHVVRHLLYLHSQDAVVVFDRVASVDKAFRKRWLLHTKSKPATANETVLQGGNDNGIVETADRRLVTTVGAGKLVHQVVLPAVARVYKIGGPDYAFYAEIDGDGSKFDGRNLAFEGGRKPRLSEAPWRVEVEPAKPAEHDVFLNVLWPRAAAEADPPLARTAASIGSTIALALGDQILVFCRHADHKEERFSFRVQRGTKRILIFGAIRGARYWVSVDGERVTLPAGKEGVITWHPPAGFAAYVTILKSADRGAVDAPGGRE